MSATGNPKVSIVIPTYNRRDRLHNTLHQLTRQVSGTPEFEVVVSDDGSSDDSATVAKSFSDRLNLKYTYQEDLGNRVALARNNGARLATAPILVFLDTGAIAGPDFVLQHYLAHSSGSPRHALAGYAYGYNPGDPMVQVPDLLKRFTPEEMVEVYGRVHEFLDSRELALLRCDDDLTRRSVPWLVFWTINCSVHTDDFWAVGGFDEGHRGWAVEDLDLGYRLHRSGLPLHFTRKAWVIEEHQDRVFDEQYEEFQANMLRFVTNNPEPVNEIGWTVAVHENMFWSWEEDNNDLIRYTDEVRDLDVSAEVEQALQGVSATDRVVVIGAGGALPESMHAATVMDFDRELIERVAATGRHVTHHSLGLRTPLADQSADVVILTSRLAKFWRRWEDQFMIEARRIGRDVRCLVP